jgi:hypothetical protein
MSVFALTETMFVHSLVISWFGMVMAVLVAGVVGASDSVSATSGEIAILSTTLQQSHD